MVPTDERKIVLGLPKGSLQESTFDIFAKAGFNIRLGSRSYYPIIDDDEIELVLLRAQEIAMYVEDGVLDAGITGKDWVMENNADVYEIAELIYAKQGLRPVKWVLAVANDSPIKTVQDLEGKRIATEAVKLVEAYLKKHNVKAKVEFSWGATEIKTPRLVDAIVDITETGASLKANNLRVVDTVLESTTRLVANNQSWQDPWKKAKLEELSMLLKSVLVAQTKVGLMMNVKKVDVDAVLSVLPALQNPTISDLSDPDWCDVITIVDKASVRKLIPQLKAKGAHGIVEYPLSKIID
ncbi:ATP phosphoribosyltransferase [Candidatus Woesearchaeota archaeon]|nr:ATP phosphoribosyltransferase [Candidatus Woesearchaeota archaeon]